MPILPPRNSVISRLFNRNQAGQSSYSSDTPPAIQPRPGEISIADFQQLAAAGAQHFIQPPSSLQSGNNEPEYAHIVQPGESWSSISASRYGDEGFWQNLMRANPQIKGGRLQPNQRILLPGRADDPNAGEFWTQPGFMEFLNNEAAQSGRVQQYDADYLRQQALTEVKRTSLQPGQPVYAGFDAEYINPTTKEQGQIFFTADNAGVPVYWDPEANEGVGGMVFQSGRMPDSWTLPTGAETYAYIYGIEDQNKITADVRQAYLEVNPEAKYTAIPVSFEEMRRVVVENNVYTLTQAQQEAARIQQEFLAANPEARMLSEEQRWAAAIEYQNNKNARQYEPEVQQEGRIHFTRLVPDAEGDIEWMGLHFRRDTVDLLDKRESTTYWGVNRDDSSEYMPITLREAPIGTLASELGNLFDEGLAQFVGAQDDEDFAGETNKIQTLLQIGTEFLTAGFRLLPMLRAPGAGVIELSEALRAKELPADPQTPLVREFSRWSNNIDFWREVFAYKPSDVFDTITADELAYLTRQGFEFTPDSSTVNISTEVEGNRIGVAGTELFAVDGTETRQMMVVLDAYRMVYPAQQKEEAKQLRIAAYNLYEDNTINTGQALDMITRAQALDAQSRTVQNPYYTYTWLTRPELEERFLQSTALIELQKGSPLTDREVQMIRANYEDVGAELPMRMIFDLSNFFMSPIITGVGKGIKKLFGVIPDIKVPGVTPFYNWLAQDSVGTSAKRIGVQATNLSLDISSNVLFSTRPLDAAGNIVAGIPATASLEGQLDILGRYWLTKGKATAEAAEAARLFNELPLNIRRLEPKLATILNIYNPALADESMQAINPDNLGSIVKRAVEEVAQAKQNELWRAAEVRLRKLELQAARSGDAVRIAAAHTERLDTLATLGTDIRTQALAFAQRPGPAAVRVGGYFEAAVRAANLDNISLTDQGFNKFGQWIGVLKKGEAISDLSPTALRWGRNTIRGVNQFLNKIKGAWITSVLTAVPRWTINNILDSAFRMLSAGGSLNDNLLTELKYVMDEGILDEALMTTFVNYAVADESVNVPEAIIRMVRAAKSPEDLKKISTLGALDEAIGFSLREVEIMGLPARSRWLVAIASVPELAGKSVKAINQYFEFSYRLRLYSRLFKTSFSTLDEIALNRVLTSMRAARASDEAIEAVEAAWRHAGPNPAKLEDLLQTMTGRDPGKISRPYSLKFPAEVTGMMDEHGITRELQHSILSSLGRRLSGIASKEELDDLLDLVRRDIKTDLTKRLEDIDDAARPYSSLSREEAGQLVDLVRVPEASRIAFNGGDALFKGSLPASLIEDLEAVPAGYRRIYRYQPPGVARMTDWAIDEAAAANFKTAGSRLVTAVVSEEEWADAVKFAIKKGGSKTGLEGRFVVKFEFREIIEVVTDPDKVQRVLGNIPIDKMSLMEVARTEVISAPSRDAAIDALLRTDIKVIAGELAGKAASRTGLMSELGLVGLDAQNIKYVMDGRTPGQRAIRLAKAWEINKITGPVDAIIARLDKYEDVVLGKALGGPGDDAIGFTDEILNTADGRHIQLSTAHTQAGERQALARFEVEDHVRKLTNEITEILQRGDAGEVALLPQSKVNYLQTQVERATFLRDKVRRFALEVFPGPLFAEGIARRQAFQTFEALDIGIWNAVTSWLDDANELARTATTIEELAQAKRLEALPLKEMLENMGLRISVTPSPRGPGVVIEYLGLEQPYRTQISSTLGALLDRLFPGASVSISRAEELLTQPYTRELIAAVQAESPIPVIRAAVDDLRHLYEGPRSSVKTLNEIATPSELAHARYLNQKSIDGVVFTVLKPDGELEDYLKVATGWMRTDGSIVTVEDEIVDLIVRGKIQGPKTTALSTNLLRRLNTNDDALFQAQRIENGWLDTFGPAATASRNTFLDYLEEALIDPALTAPARQQLHMTINQVREFRYVAAATYFSLFDETSPWWGIDWSAPAAQYSLPDWALTRLKHVETAVGQAKGLTNFIEDLRPKLVDRLANKQLLFSTISESSRASVNAVLDPAIVYKQAARELAATGAGGLSRTGLGYDNLVDELLAEARGLGLDVGGAINRTNKAMIDYSTETNFDTIMRNVMPFWRFQSKSPVYWAGWFSKHPWAASAYFKHIKYSRVSQIDAGIVNERGEPLYPYGYIRLPGTDIWINPLAPYSFKAVLPTRFPGDDEGEGNVFITYLAEWLQVYGVNASPWINEALYKTGLIDPNTMPRWTFVPQLDLIPVWVQRDLENMVRKIDKPIDGPRWGAENPWLDSKIETRLLAKALEDLRNAPPTQRQAILAEIQKAMGYEVTNRGQYGEPVEWRFNPVRDTERWREAQQEVEESDWHSRMSGYLTAVYFREFSDAELELRMARMHNNFLRDSINNEVLAYFFGLEPDPEARYNIYRNNRYGETGEPATEGQLASLYAQLGWVSAPEDPETRLYGLDRRQEQVRLLHENEVTGAYYDSVFAAKERRDAALAALPIGVDKERITEIYATWDDEQTAIKNNPIFSAAQTSEYSIGYKPLVMLAEHYVDQRYFTIKQSYPQYDPIEAAQDDNYYIDYKRRVLEWEQLIFPLLADRTFSVIDSVVQADITRQGELYGGQLLDSQIMAKQVAEQITLANYYAWKKDSNTEIEAANDGWEELYWSRYWDAVGDKSGYERELAEREFYKTIEKPTVEDIAEWILTDPIYAEKWTKAHLLESLGGNEILTIQQRLQATGGDEQKMKDLGWDLVGNIPPGTLARKELEEAFILTGGDSENLSTWFDTAGDWKGSEEFITDLDKALRYLGWTTPSDAKLQEWVEVQSQNKDFTEGRDNFMSAWYGKDWQMIVDLYFSYSGDKRREFKKQNNKLIDQYFELRCKFGETHPLWASYFIGPDDCKPSGGGGGTRRTIVRRGGGGGGGSGTAGSSFIPQGYRAIGPGISAQFDPARMGTGGIGGRPFWPPGFGKGTPVNVLHEITDRSTSGTPLSSAASTYLINTMAAKAAQVALALLGTVAFNYATWVNSLIEGGEVEPVQQLYGGGGGPALKQ